MSGVEGMDGPSLGQTGSIPEGLAELAGLRLEEVRQYCAWHMDCLLL